MGEVIVCFDLLPPLSQIQSSAHETPASNFRTSNKLALAFITMNPRSALRSSRHQYRSTQEPVDDVCYARSKTLANLGCFIACRNSANRSSKICKATGYRSCPKNL